MRLRDWQAHKAEVKALKTQQLDALIALWTRGLVMATFAFIMIGTAPYLHEVVYDPLTGGAVMSPINRIMWLGLLGMALPVVILRLDRLVALLAKVWPLFLLFAWFAVSTTWAIDPAASNRRLFLYFVNLIICTAIILGLPDERILHRTLAQTCAIIILIDLFSWAFLYKISMTEIGLAAIHNHKNTLGSMMLLSVGIITPYALSRPTAWGRIFWWAMVASCFALLVVSQSKTSLALAIVGMIIGPIILNVSVWRKDVLTGLAMLIGAAVMTVVFGWLFYCAYARLDPLAPFAKITFTQRTDVWKFVIEEWLKRPWQGVGFASFWDVDPAVQPSKQTDLWFAQPESPTNEAHNGYLDILVSTGIPGLIMAMGLLINWIIRAFSLMRQGWINPAAEPGPLKYYAIFLFLFPVFFFVHNLMESSFFTANAPYGFVILLVGLGIDWRAISSRNRAAMATSSIN
jgi:exopolysaccharide production protein ExoQ